MKKILLMIAVAVSSMAFSAKAQDVAADFSKMDQLVVKLGKAIEKTPKASGIAEVDGYVEGAQTAASAAVASADKLHNFYSRQVGETADGVTTVTENKPTLDDWLELSESIAAQTVGLAKVGDKAADAASAVKSAPKTKAIGLTKTVKWSADILPVVGEALAEQAKAVNEIISTIKSSDNL